MIIYSIYDITNNQNKFVFSSNDIDEVYNKTKSVLGDTINYEEFKVFFKNKMSCSVEYQSNNNFKRVLVTKTYKGK